MLNFTNLIKTLAFFPKKYTIQSAFFHKKAPYSCFYSIKRQVGRSISSVPIAASRKKGASSPRIDMNIFLYD